MTESKDSKSGTLTADLIAQTTVKLKGMFGGNISTKNMVDLVTQGMIIAKSFSSADGATKKNIVLTSIKNVVAEEKFPAETKAGVDLFIDAVAPGLIDTAVWLSQQKIDFNPKKCFPCCG